MAGTSDDKMKNFMAQVKQIGEEDKVLTSAEQIHRLTKPGSSYLNMNPFEALLLDPDAPIEEARKKFKRLSLLIHPDKNPDDRERADAAFHTVKQAIAQLEDTDLREKFLEIVTEARARTDMALDVKRKKLRRDGKSDEIEEDDPRIYKELVRNMTNRLFAEKERRRRLLEERANEDKKRKAEEAIETAEKKRKETEFKQNFEVRNRESPAFRIESFQRIHLNEPFSFFEIYICSKICIRFYVSDLSIG